MSNKILPNGCVQDLSSGLMRTTNSNITPDPSILMTLKCKLHNSSYTHPLF